MPAIASQLDPRSDDFRANADFHRSLVDELDRRLARAAEGGGQTARDKHVGIVSVPIESRYQGEFRSSHFRPIRDVTRITLYTCRRIAAYGHMVASYRKSHGTPPLIYDPEHDEGR